MNQPDSKFRSRKFITTHVIAFYAVALCAFDKMDGGATSAVLLACGAMYQWANAKTAS